MNDNEQNQRLAASVERLRQETSWTEATCCNLLAAYMNDLGYTSPEYAVDAILAGERSPSLSLKEDEDSEEEEDDYTPFAKRDAAERLEVAVTALEHMSEEWLQDEFGTDQTDVIFEALNLYIDQHHDDVLHTFLPTGKRCRICGNYLPEELTPKGVDNTN